MASEPTPIPNSADLGPAERMLPDQARTRQALERLLDRGLLGTPVAQSGVRDVIERSWRRCVGAEVPVGRHDIPYALQALMRWPWPGNLAELRRTVEQLARRRADRSISSTDLPPRMQRTPLRGLGMIETAERDAIINALHRFDGNRTKAAAALGIGRTTLYRKLQTYRIPAGE